MKYTRQDVFIKTGNVRARYHAGTLSDKEITQYESLVGWHWGRIYIPFSEARTLTRAQKLSSAKEFHAWKKPEGMPSHPESHYKTSGWLGYGDFLGTGTIRTGNREFMSFIKARTLAQAQLLAGARDFDCWNKPEGMPSNPNRIYKNSGWLGWFNFLGNKRDSCHPEKGRRRKQ